MFEAMEKNKKAWLLFCNWSDKNKKYKFDSLNKNFKKSIFMAFLFICYETIDNDFILSIMPFFFDEIGIDTYIDQYAMFFNREKAIMEACEKAFEILEAKI